MSKEGRPRVVYADPRARRLMMNAWIALGLVSLPTCMLGPYLVTSGGVMNVLGWGLVAAIMALSIGGIGCLVMAPVVEARFVRALDELAVKLDQAEADRAAEEARHQASKVPAAAFQPVEMPDEWWSSTEPASQPRYAETLDLDPDEDLVPDPVETGSNVSTQADPAGVAPVAVPQP